MTTATGGIEGGVDFSGHVPGRNKYALACSLLASLASILLGYDIGVMSGAVIYIKEDLKITDVQVEILAGILHVFSLIGSAAAGRTSDWIGRRYTIVVASVIFFAGAILMGFAANYAFLMAGRFVAGVGVGYALMIAPVYTAKVSPASSRGKLTSFPEVFINVGILLGYVSNVVFTKLPLHLTWRLMLGVGAIPSIFLGFSVVTMPESPRWLVMQGRLGEAQSVLNRTSDTLEEAQLRLADIKEAAGIPEHVRDDVVPATKCPKGAGGEGVWRELFVSPTPAVRHILLIGVCFHFFQQATGIETVVLYSPRIFEKAGIKSDHNKLLCTVAVGSIKTLFILIATFTLDRFRRRKLLLTSIGGMAASMVFLAIGLTVVDHTDHKVTWALVLSITMVLSYVSFFSMGMWPITWVYNSEIFPLRLRATGCNVGVAVNRTMSAATSMTFISLYKAVTIGGAFFLYSSVAVVSFVFFYTLMPETRGRTLEEMESLFGSFFKWRSTLKELDNYEAATAKKAANPPQRVQMSSSNDEHRQSG